MGEWRETNLGDFATVTVGPAFKSVQFTDDPRDIRLMRGINAGVGRVEWGATKYWPAAGANGYERFLLQEGDVVLAMDRPWIDAGLKVATVKLADTPSLLVQRVARLRASAPGDQGFVAAIVKTPEFTEYLRSVTGGTSVPHISSRDISSFSFALPPPSVRHRVATIIKTFDELIEINERRIELLEDLARSLYREWFAHFRFPGHEDVEMVDSELGAIPVGWKVGRLEEVCSVNREGFKASEIPDPCEYLDISSVGIRRLGSPQSLAAADAPGRARRRLRDGDTVWATVRPNRRAHCLIHEPPPNIVASTGLAVLSPTAVPASYLFEYSSDAPFTEYLMGRATGAAYPAVRPPDFREAPVLIPPQEHVQRFDSVVDRMHRSTSHLSALNRQLATTRDLLLPRLVTGRLDISDLDLGVLTPAETE